eukprot:2021795-Pyramimonas_sp.AAC.1
MGQPLRQARSAGRPGPTSQIIEGPKGAVGFSHMSVAPQQPAPNRAARHALRGSQAAPKQRDREKVST